VQGGGLGGEPLPAEQDQQGREVRIDGEDSPGVLYRCRRARRSGRERVQEGGEQQAEEVDAFGVTAEA
jgi:hypothetical protein